MKTYEMNVQNAYYFRRKTTKIRSIWYLPGSSTAAETKYYTTQGKCRVVVWWVLRLSFYEEGKQFTIRTDRESAEFYFKLSQAAPATEKSATQVANIFRDSWIILFCIPSYVLIQKCQQFLRNVFGTMCTYLDGEHLTTTEYHQQTDE